jgi:hypothetical protein
VPQHGPSPFDQLSNDQSFWFVHIVNIDIEIIIDDIASCCNQQGLEQQ